MDITNSKNISLTELMHVKFPRNVPIENALSVIKDKQYHKCNLCSDRNLPTISTLNFVSNYFVLNWFIISTIYSTSMVLVYTDYIYICSTFHPKSLLALQKRLTETSPLSNNQSPLTNIPPIISLSLFLCGISKPLKQSLYLQNLFMIWCKLLVWVYSSIIII